jgi:hypothetical protein
MPSLTFLLSIAGLGVSLTGFAGLVAALRRGAQWKPLDVYRLRQIPEMGLATTILALSSVPLSETVGSSATAIRVASAAGFAFALIHSIALLLRARTMRLKLTGTNWWAAAALDASIYVVAGVSIWIASAVAYEWLLILLLSRAALAFMLVLGEMPTSVDGRDPIQAGDGHQPAANLGERSPSELTSRI